MDVYKGLHLNSNMGDKGNFSTMHIEWKESPVISMKKILARYMMKQ